MSSPRPASPAAPSPLRGGTASGHLQSRVAEARAEAFAGRASHLSAFTDLLAASAAADGGQGGVLYVHGPAGVGKTALLHRYDALARAEGRHVLRVDVAGAASPQALGDQVGTASGRPGPVVLLDNVDDFPGPAAELARVLASRLPYDAVAVLAGRGAPDPAWSGDTGWHGLLDILPLGPLSPTETDDVLTELGVPSPVRATVARFAHGHPLALTLSATARATHRFRAGEVPPEVVLPLLDRMVGEVPGPAHRQALEISAHSRWTTEDLLRAVLPEPAGAAVVFDWLRRRPYIVSDRHGVAPDPLVRDLLDTDLRWRDPTGYAAMHVRIRSHVLDRIRRALPNDILPATMALTYLHRHNGFVSRFVTWRTEEPLQEIPYRPELREDLLRLVTCAEGPTAASTLAPWLTAQPRAFRLYWDTVEQQPVAALAWLRLDTGAQETIAQDPVASAAWRHAQSTRPLRPHEHLAVARLYAHPSVHRTASPLLDLMIHRVLASFIRLDDTAWTFLTLPTGTFLDPLMRYIDQRPLAEPVRVDNLSFTLYAHDWRAVPLQRWMEVGHLVELAGPDARPAARPRVGPASLTVLTREEFDAAVADALTAWQRRDLLARNPLVQTRMVMGRGGEPVEALREILTAALDTLDADPRAAKYHRAVVTGLLRGAPTREAAAERLGLPLSTFRRHLGRGLDEIRAHLWDLEMHSPGGSEPSADEPADNGNGTGAVSAP
ncbi:AAA family ATPase [Streptomyces olivaceoviridis]|uniref:AAA family ATPase n=1 Tax=Streptomyces olivaceoviridis TaxID=1921 RepID=UPI003678FE46